METKICSDFRSNGTRMIKIRPASVEISTCKVKNQCDSSKRNSICAAVASAEKLSQNHHCLLAVVARTFVKYQKVTKICFQL